MSTTVKIYLIGEDNRFLGSIEHDQNQPLPRCTLTAPPPIAADQDVLWFGDRWAVVSKASLVEKNIDLMAAAIRAERNQLLTISDWTQLPDAPVDKQAWAVYRQTLRDVTSQAEFPVNVVWPNQPTLKA